jgi:metacaspase-1
MGGSRALCIGLNYSGTSSALQGCINDALNLKKLLASSGAVKAEDITVMCEPKGQEICDAIKSLASSSVSQQLDYVFISYSGHGSQIRDRNGDEIDGKDECLCPSDFSTRGVVTDDMLKDMLRGFRPQTTVCFLCDACHSGSMLDLNRTYTSTICTLTRDTSIPSRVVYISGCMDPQTSADAFDRSRSMYTGAMTSAFLDVLNADPSTRKDVFKLVSEMRKLLRARGFSQFPLLSSSFDLPRSFSFVRYSV